MSLLADIQTVVAPLGIPIETGVFKDEAPRKYIVVTPISDNFDLHADNAPGMEIQEVRLSLFTQGSYTKWKNALVRALLAADITITDRRYVGHEDDSGYHNYAIDVAKSYEMEE